MFDLWPKSCCIFHFPPCLWNTVFFFWLGNCCPTKSGGITRECRSSLALPRFSKLRGGRVCAWDRGWGYVHLSSGAIVAACPKVHTSLECLLTPTPRRLGVRRAWAAVKTEQIVKTHVKVISVAGLLFRWLSYVVSMPHPVASETAKVRWCAAVGDMLRWKNSALRTDVFTLCWGLQGREAVFPPKLDAETG